MAVFKIIGKLALLFGMLFLISCSKSGSSEEVFVMPDLAYMSPAIEPLQRVLVEPFESDESKSKVNRLDLIVFKRTVFPAGTHVLRVLGLPRDQIAFTSEGIVVNGEKLTFSSELSYLNEGVANYVQGNGDSYYEVPGQAFFLIGDNLEKALDSRIFGSVVFDDVYAEVIQVTD